MVGDRLEPEIELCWPRGEAVWEQTYIICLIYIYIICLIYIHNMSYIGM